MSEQTTTKIEEAERRVIEAARELAQTSTSPAKLFFEKIFALCEAVDALNALLSAEAKPQQTKGDRHD